MDESSGAGHELQRLLIFPILSLMRVQGPFSSTLSICPLFKLSEYENNGVTHVISITDPDYNRGNLHHFGQVSRLELRFHDIVEDVQGLIAPQLSDIHRILEFGLVISHSRSSPTHLLIHCHGGISRSTAAMILVLAQVGGESSAQDAVALTLQMQPNALPNLRMIRLGDQVLSYNGTLVVAVERHYANLRRKYPKLAGILTS